MSGANPKMDVATARSVVCQESPPLVRLHIAGGVLCDAVLRESSEATLLDVLPCLRHDRAIAELAAFTLHRRTGRPMGETVQTRFVMDVDDWKAYLKVHEFIG